MAEQPLLEPAVLVTENCPECKGTGERVGSTCSACDGAARIVSEVPMSVAFRMLQDHAARATAPPPSALRAQPE